MDPNEALEIIRRVVAAINTERNEFADKTEQADDLAAIVGSLDEWLTKGGFLPSDWAKKG